MNPLFKFFKKMLWKFSWALSSFKQRPEFHRIYTEIGIRDESAELSVFEIFNVYSAVLSTAKIPGDIAEVGVFKGGSAKVICIAREQSGKPGNSKIIHLFDTFEGLPEVDTIDTKQTGGKFSRGEYAASLESVQHYLEGYHNIHFYKGLFPSTADPVKNITFSFLHLDVDIYQSTKDALKFFYPRMNKGGIIISHDYPFANGVKKAFDEFFADKPETVISL